ncbi:hypothetical protein BD626DRAFT_571618 [Schizophyllum amplum]|uniref:BTB domain-containing protein n=1 Tax=Schizophyllum amplum TaxID=97359 RepID=A0A550C6X8_9AGAR|nr:hypothetical protein BD626DRAFT_571618 [Auriculariopsis ampla]
MSCKTSSSTASSVGEVKESAEYAGDSAEVANGDRGSPVHSDGEERTLKRVQELWFDDGNIVLQAEDTQFRVHRSILAIHSNVFRGMLSLPQTACDEEKIDGCPVVFLPGDAAQDMTYLFMAIYYSDFFESAPAPTTFAIAAGVLRAATKYDILMLRHRAVRHFDTVYPTELPPPTVDAAAGVLNSFGTFQPSRQEDGEALLLARTLDLPWIRPYAMYRVSTRGLIADQETMQSALDFQCVSIADRFACLQAQTKLLYATLNDVLSFLRTSHTSHSCQSADRCKQSRIEWMEESLQWDWIDPFMIEFEPRWEKGLCEECVCVAKADFEDGRALVWAKLPLMFGVADSWDELETLKIREHISGI